MAALAGEVETGVVTPHNAQRGRLKSLLGEQTEIETVERYQGGQRECMIVSATASDPDFLSAEQDFILNPNRLNVALSRMETKLIVTAAESIFELIPSETRKYEQSRLWKGLYKEVEVFGREPAWEGPIRTIQTAVTAGVEVPAVTARVYSLPLNPES
jgi:superfamily I DNA and/or RNA helicase